MPTYPLAQVDAFTNTPLEGNPCAVVFDADSLDDATMQAIAREMNLSETAFVKSSDKATIGARYFTPAEEIPLAGHPTIATIFALFERGLLTFEGSAGQITLELKAGVIPVDVTGFSGKIERVIMSQIKPKFLRTYDPEDVMPMFGLSPDDLLPGATIQTVSTGTPQLMIPVKSLSVLRRIQVETVKYINVYEKGDFFSPHVFALEGATEAGHTFARHFGLPPDTSEDPFTGSATGNMGAYLWHYGLIMSPKFIAEQGHWMQRPGQATVEVVGSRSDIETVRVGGAAVTVFEGTLTLP